MIKAQTRVKIGSIKKKRSIKRGRACRLAVKGEMREKI